MKQKKSNRYLKIVEWSEKDRCYVGTAPGLILGGVHGKDQKKVFEELCDVVEESISLFIKDRRPLPKSTANKKYSGKILLRIPAEIHKTLILEAMQEGESLNKVIQNHLQGSL